MQTKRTRLVALTSFARSKENSLYGENGKTDNNSKGVKQQQQQHEQQHRNRQQYENGIKSKPGAKMANKLKVNFRG